MFSHTTLLMQKGLIKKLVKDVLHFFLYIINPKKYCTFELRALCVGARTMHGLEITELSKCHTNFVLDFSSLDFFLDFFLAFKFFSRL